ncbi:MAG: hypothetical protein FWF49_00900 [Oscillospiraceae bacterium]|nr:hypothetical protein [Oscillospiraceae bacterium]
MKRILSLALCAMFSLALLSGCQASSKLSMQGGTAIPAVDMTSYNLSPWYLSNNGDLGYVYNDWLVGVQGSSLKVTTKSASTGLWYKSALPSTWILNTDVDLSAVTGASKTSIDFGADKSSPAVQVVLETDAKKQVRFSVLQNGAQLSATKWFSSKDSVFTILIDTVKVSGSWCIYLTGAHISAAVQLPLTNDGISSLSFTCDAAGVVFTNLALDSLPWYPGMLMDIGQNAMDDAMGNFWNPDLGRIVNTAWDGNNPPIMVWTFGILLLPLEDIYTVTGDQKYLNYISNEWQYMQMLWTDKKLTTAGDAPNNWQDDMGATAVILMTIYRMTGDMHALQLAGDCVRNAYAYFKDGTTANGLWYDTSQQYAYNQYIKSIYDVSLILTGLQYCSIVNDPDLLQQTMDLYNWNETHMLRSDNLYWVNYVDHPGSPDDGPQGKDHPEYIGVNGSMSSSLFGNMAMAVIHAQLYKMTGDTHYLDRAVQTANALGQNPAYVVSGVLVNDRDCWTNAMYVGQLVRQVLPLPGVCDELKNAIKNTAIAAYHNCRTPDGYYGPVWSPASNYWATATIIGQPVSAQQATTTGTTVNMITAGALEEKFGLLPST